MSSHARESIIRTAAERGDDEMNIDSDAPSQPSNTEAHPPEPSRRSLVNLLRDVPNWLSAVRNLQETDIIILLTPVIIPIGQEPTDISDPFEPLGRSLAKRHPRIRQVPYTQRNGITSTHLGFIKRGHVIILCFAPERGQQFQQDFAEVTFALSDNKPCVIVICCNPTDTPQTIPFPTVIQAIDYSPLALEATAALIFGEQSQLLSNETPDPVYEGQPQARLWLVEQWNEARDITGVLSLWTECISDRFAIDQHTLASVLRRPGYAKHYVVRESRNGEILGFCATYLSYVDKEGENLIASLALLLVRSSKRQQGIGLSLHSHAISQLKKTRGVIRLQLGSTFPRILYGPPSEMQLNEEWFLRRGWQLNRAVPGQGKFVCDMVLDFADWRYAEEQSRQAYTNFRLCTQEDMVRVLEIVETTSTREAKMGWYDQYLSLMNGPNVKDVILGIKDDTLIATALTYTPSCGSQIASNLPWAGRIGNDIGGVTCICISPSAHDFVIVGLLDASIKNLRTQGMTKMFIDGVTNDSDHLTTLGFREWSRYRDVWKDI